jgi:hypothetical protein
MVRVLELLTDETAELVDKYHRPFVDSEYLPEIPKRPAALVAAAQELRRIAETVLDKTDFPALPEKGAS